MSSVFLEVMGESPRMRIMDYLLEGRELDVSMTDIIESAGTGRQTTYEIVEELLNLSVLLQTRTIGRSRLFKLNPKHPAVRKLSELDDLLMKEELRRKTILSKIS
jgi:predicted transcriptional regulator